MFLANTLVFVQLFLYVVAVPVEDIVGEEKVHFGDTPEESYPSLVSLGDETRHFCGATLITDRHLLTAAHCFPDTEVYRVVIGSKHKFIPEGPGAQVMTFGPEAWQLNPGYKGEANGHIYDTAIITLPQAVKLSETVQPIRLAKKAYENNVRVVGWGRMDCNEGFPFYYLSAKGTIYDHSDCDTVYKKVGGAHSSQICATFTNKKGERSGSDSGDSGGPLYATADDGKDVQIGTVSLSIKQNEGTPQECTQPKVPMKYGNVAEAYDFIKKYAPDAVFV